MSAFSAERSTPEVVDALEAEYDTLFEQGSALQDGDEPTGEIAERLQAIEAEIVAINGGERYRPEDMALAGAIVSLGHDGEARIERGLVRKEDEPERPTGGGEPDCGCGSARH